MSNHEGSFCGGQPAAIGINHDPGIPTTPAITGARNSRI
jgi:hypothetical protein